MGVSPEFLSLFFLCFAASTHACNPGDKAALRDFAMGLRHPRPWSADNQSPDCCRWIGVICTGNSSTMPSSRRVESLNLPNMGLTGMISGSIGNLSQLKYLDLSFNSLFGSIPKGLFAASSLKTLDLSFNTLSGNLSYALGNLSKLTLFDVSSNNLSGPISDVFHAFGENLNYLELSSNNFSGSIPESLSACKALRLLDFSNNSLSGTISVDFSRLVSLETLSIASNQFSGPIPESIFSCTNLKTLWLSNNRFRGDFRAGFGSRKSLQSLFLSRNSFSNITVTFTALNQLSNLKCLSLNENFKGESIPTDGSWRFPRLKILSMKDSNISGFIPTWISTLSELVLLDLSGNRLQGTIPAWFGNFKNITVLHLSGNMLTGDIPVSLTRPGNPAFKRVVVHEEGISYGMASSLDLSSNLLKGTSWRSIGNLKNLFNLNLSHNSFTGSISGNFSDMRHLEYLDLSCNQISGVIPSSLQDLTFLKEFSVANNSLEGQVPIGGQLLTFGCSSFAGNPGLKFSSLFNCTSETPASGRPAKFLPHESEDSFGSSHPTDDILMGFLFSMGVLIGFVSAVIAHRFAS